MLSLLPRRLSARVWAVGALGLALAAGGLQPAAAAPAGPVDPRLDLTGNQVVNSADVADAAEGWAEFVGGAGGGAADVNGDGAVDIADVQQVAAHAGRGATPAGEAALQAVVPQQDAPVREFVVNSGASGDPNRAGIADANRGDGRCATTNGDCTLQAAVQETNAPRIPPYHARIVFDIRESGACPAVVRIMPNLDYERWLQIDDSSGQGTTIDGYTQCDARANTGAVEGNAVIKIELVGTKLGAGGVQYGARKGVNGIEVKSSNNVIRGLALYNWDRQLELSAPGALFNRVEGNFLGTDAANNFLSKARPTHEGEGVRIQFGASYNVLGCGTFRNDGTFQPCADAGQAHAARNIVAGNGNDGIHIEGVNSSFNHIVGNYVGVAQDGKVRKNSGGTSLSKNTADGVDFEDGASHNWLGGESELERNIVAGNASDGIEISHNVRTVENRVVGNYFGLDAYGEIAANGNNGISIEDRANKTYIYRNFVGGNAQSGIRTYVLAHENQIYENSVGVGPDGSPRPNTRHGVYLMGGSQRNLVRDNIIAYNGDRGVVISTESDADKGYFGETYFNTISRNTIHSNFREGIKLTNRDDPQPVGNQNLPKPLIVAAGAELVVGDACANCKIEIFIADKAQVPEPRGENSGEGRTFVGEAVANGAGQFAVPVAGVAVGQLVTGTATDQSGNTSEFARNVRVNAGPVATLTPVPTFTSTPTATSTPTTEPTPPPGSTPTATRTPGEAPQDFRVYLPAVRR
jgi:parallel beta-helix repeat protein